MLVIKKSVALLVMAAIILVGLVSPSGEVEAAAIERYKFSVKDINGKSHTVTMASNKETREVAADSSAFATKGDILYSGVYYFTVNGKKQSTFIRNNQVLNLNPSQRDVYKVTSAGKGTPDLIIIGERESSNYYSFEAYAVAPNGKMREVGFLPYGSKQVEYEMYASSLFKNYTSTYFQLARYDNSEAAGWYFDTYKFNKDNYLMYGAGILFYGYDKPYAGVKKGSYEEGQKLIARFEKEPKFGVTSASAPAAASSTLKFVMDSNTKANLKAGKIPGFNVQMGNSFEQVSKVLGAKTTWFYETGGKFWQFTKAPGAGFSFNSNGGLNVVLISKPHLPKMTFKSVKTMLGTPEFEGEDELDGGYLSHFKFNEMNIFFSGPAQNGEIIDVMIMKRKN